MAQEKAKKEKKNSEQHHEDPPIGEWIVATVGLILVAGAICFMLYQAITQDSSPPGFSVRVDSITTNDGGGHLVKFRIKNSGETAAAAVNVKGELKRGDENVEDSSVTLTYVPSNSEREGGILFSENPNEYQLKLRVEGYEKP
jgi:uncharacterized protein (TIGR02588 family)